MACVALVQAAQYTKGKQKMDLMFYHKSFGLLAASLLAPRILLRFTSKMPSHLPGTALWEIAASKITHVLMYGFMIFMPISGVAMGYYGGKGLPFFFTTVAGAEVADGKIAKQAYDKHKLIGHYAQFLIPAHVGAVGFHYFAQGKNLMPRMLSWLKPK